MEDMASDNALVSRDKALLQVERVLELLSKAYWAEGRPEDVVRKSIDNSICFGVYVEGVQVGFARVITDYATAYYICDVIISETYRGKGLGKKLIDTIVNDDCLKSLFGILATRDAHGLYEKFGFGSNKTSFMCRRHKE